ncbi:hypothetical protein G6011_05234 [Alternaria panax]|uniref:Uncharacterized protein n=1 Tax=Alternaria panax TaxID=48097 RepID=A0AAD4I6C4_9PLEO|nr:hypothetical protein G6011_05234 [Alternaria panax]
MESIDKHLPLLGLRSQYHKYSKDKKLRKLFLYYPFNNDRYEKAKRGEQQTAQNVLNFRHSAQKYKAKAASDLVKEKERSQQALPERMTKATQLEDDLASTECSKPELQHMLVILEHQIKKSEEASKLTWQSLQDCKLEIVVKVGEIEGLGSDVEKLKADLTVAKQEAAAAKQRIVKI